MKPGRKSFTANIILIFLIFNLFSVMIFTIYMQRSGQKAALEYARSNLLEVTKEKSELLAIAFDRIRNRTESTGIYMEEVLGQDISLSIGEEYILTEDKTVMRKRDKNRSASSQSNVFVPAQTLLSEDLIREINATEKLDPYFSHIIKNEDVSWCYIVTGENLLRCSPYRNLSEFFSRDHSQVSDIFYTNATDKNNPDHSAVWTQPYFDYLGTGWIMTCSQPVYDEKGELFGVICLDLSINKVKEKYFNGFSLGETGKLCWMSNQGQVYYHTDYDSLTADQGEILEKNIFEDDLSASREKVLKDGVLKGGSGIEVWNENGKKKMFIFSQVNGTDSVLFMEIGMEDFQSFYEVDLKGIMVVGFINLILSVCFAMILYYRFSRPMKKLVDQAQRISEGGYAEVHFKRPCNSGYDEMNRLNEALCIMNENLVSYTESLRDKNREIGVILEAIDETLMIVDTDGTIILKSKDFTAIPERGLKNSIEKVVAACTVFEEQVIVGAEVYKNAYYPILKGSSVDKIVVSSECITKAMLVEKELQQIEKMAGVGQLAAALVHEMKNILARIGGAAYLLKFTAAGKSEEAETIQKAVNEAEDLIAALLDFSARDKNGSEMIHLGTLINQILLLFKKEIIGKDIVVSKEIDGECYINSNGREAVKVILQNIISNAIQAAGSGGKIKIICRQEGDRAVVRIRDSGPGICVAPKEKIFEPFLTTKENGNGIGLWITKRLVDTLEGTIIVEEPEGGGAEFSVFIPVEKREVDR